jgi:hypothetical protein
MKPKITPKPKAKRDVSQILEFTWSLKRLDVLVVRGWRAQMVCEPVRCDSKRRPLPGTYQSHYDLS